jgi:hypothetical protein
MALSKLIIAFLSLTSVSTIYLLSENDEVEDLECGHTCPEVHQMNTERLDRMTERLAFLERVAEKMWEKK